MTIRMTPKKDRILTDCLEKIAQASRQLEKDVIFYNPNEVWLRVLNMRDPYDMRLILSLMRSLSNFMNWIAAVLPCGITFERLRTKPNTQQIEGYAQAWGAQIASLRLIMTSIAVEEDPGKQDVMLRDFAPDEPFLITSFDLRSGMVVEHRARFDDCLLDMVVRHGFFVQAMKGDTVLLRKCQASDCNQFFVPMKKTHGQIYHSASCRSRTNSRKRRTAQKPIHNGGKK